MRCKRFGFVTAFMTLGAISAFAGGPAYSPDDIVKFFMDQQATRALCVGTEQDCGFTDKKQMGYNLRVTFEKNSATLTEDAKSNLSAFAEALKSPSLAVASFSINGYTDASGSDNYNKSLSERRASAVVAYLGEQGVDTGKLKAQGFGEADPLGNDPLDPDNRRVETKLVIQ